MSSSISLLFAGLGAVVAAVGGGMLLARLFRTPRPHLISWSIALIGLLVSLGAQALGYLTGFDAALFRAMSIGGLVVAPLAAVLGMSEIAGKSLAARFCARVYIPALAIVAVVVLYLDELSDTAFNKKWPNPHVYYQAPPNYVLYFTSVVTVLIIAIAAGVVMKRSGKRDWAAVSTPQVTVGIAAIMLAYPGLALAATYEAKQNLPLTSLFTPLLAIAAGLIVWAGLKFDRFDIASLHSGQAPGMRDDDAGGWGRGGDPRDPHGPGGPGESRPRATAGRGGGYLADQTGDFERFDGGGRGTYRDGPDDGSYESYEYGQSDRRSGYGDDWERAGSGRDEHGYDDGFQTGDLDLSQLEPGLGAAASLDSRPVGREPAEDDRRPAARHSEAWREAPDGPAGRPAESPSRRDLFGQIAIYTLLEDRVHEFDQLIERVVADVRGQEPDTLVFIVHAVPSAPMQRILYEVYRDRAAYEWHRQRPYVARFEADRRPYVLATNVIELGLQQAKVSPFPSVSELFGEPGYYTSGFERPDYLRDYGKPPASHGDSRGGRW
jgi:quinol monooxygenase YgiN